MIDSLDDCHDWSFDVCGLKYLVAVDWYSNWPLVYLAMVIWLSGLGKIVRRLCMTKRVSEEVRSDGGKLFMLGEF